MPLLVQTRFVYFFVGVQPLPTNFGLKRYVGSLSHRAQDIFYQLLLSKTPGSLKEAKTSANIWPKIEPDRIKKDAQVWFS